MKFDIDREFRGSSWYIYMKPEDLAFHDALDRMVVLDSMHHRIEYTRLWKGKSRNIYPEVVVDREGNIRANLRSSAKNDRAMIKISDIQKCMDIVLEFLTAAFDHGYLLHDEEAGHDGT
jgi:hypothetical protein